MELRGKSLVESLGTTFPESFDLLQIYTITKYSEERITIFCQRIARYNKKLSYRRGTVRRAMLVDSCYVSRGMGARKVSNSKSNLQGHPGALVMVPFDRPHTISY